jgi:hypothetical protein
MKLSILFSKSGTKLELEDLMGKKELDFPLLNTQKKEVVKIILKSLPIPDENTPWERILDFNFYPIFDQGKYRPGAK